MTNRIWRKLILVSAMAGAGFAQSPLVFEVASIKPSDPDSRGSMLQFVPGGGLKVMNHSLKQLMTFAYDVRDFQISGGPAWVESARYDVLAKPGGSQGLVDIATASDQQRDEQIRQMRERLQSLLKDRFQLLVHKESKESSVYALLVAKNGPKFEESKEQDAHKQGIRQQSDDKGKHTMTATGMPMGVFTTGLSGMLGRPVVDRTGLSAKYDFQMEWTQDQSAKIPDAAGVSLPDNSGPSIFTAIQQQLGLRLESQKGPVEIIVIDRVEKPSEN